MGHINVTDEWLYEKMPQVDENIIRELEAQIDNEYQFSPQFERKMKKIMCKKKRINGRLYYIRLAAIVACAALIISTAAVGVYANRLYFFEKVQSALKDIGMFRYSYYSENELKKFEIKVPGYVPDGYSLSYQNADQYSVIYVYQNSIGTELTYNQCLVVDGMVYGFDSEYDWKEELQITCGNIQVFRYLDGFVSCYMEYRDCIFTLHAVDLNNQDIEHIYTKWIFS